MRFSKKIVTVCIVVVLIYTAIQIYMSYKMSFELSPTLTTCFYAFFGAELASCAAIKVFENEQEVERLKNEERQRKRNLRMMEKERDSKKGRDVIILDEESNTL